MKERAILGVFPFVDDTVKAIEELKKAGFKEIEAYSPIPSEEIEEALEAEEKVPFSFSLDFFRKLLAKVFQKRDFQVARFTALGAFLGVIGAFLLAGGTAILWPIQTGGMPILALPAIGLVTYELMSLGAAVMSVLGFVFLAKLLRFRLEVYDPKASDDRFCLVLEDKGEQRLAEAKEIMTRCGCERVEEKGEA